LTVERTPAGHGGEGRELACPPEIAQWLHDEVVQRLCSVVAALGAESRLRGADRERCRVELEGALGALRVLLNERIEHPRERRLLTVGEAVQAGCSGRHGCAVELRIIGDVETSPETGELVADFVAEAVRNVRKHARPRSIVLTVLVDEDAVRVDAFNDGVLEAPSGAGAGVGLRLLAARALDHDGFVLTGATETDGWSTTLTLARRPRDRGRSIGASTCASR
jgi:signal transduction histidine kinase